MSAHQVQEQVTLHQIESQVAVPRILLVEDEISVRELYHTVLSSAGYQVDLACDGLEALEQLKRHHYDVLITDNMMPKLCGIDLLRKIRQTDATLPAIMISGDMPVHELDLKSLVKPGGLLTKPFSSSRLLSAIESVLKGIPFPALHSLDSCEAVA